MAVSDMWSWLGCSSAIEIAAITVTGCHLLAALSGGAAGATWILRLLGIGIPDTMTPTQSGLD